MIRKIIGAALGAKLAKDAPAKGGAAGAVVATALPFVLSRVALPGLAAIGVGAYLLGRRRKQADRVPHTARSEHPAGNP